MILYVPSGTANTELCSIGQGWGLHSVLCIGWKSIQYFTTRVSQHLDGLLFVTVSECLSYQDHNEHNTSM